MIRRKKKPTKSNKSSTYKNSTRNSRRKIPKLETYEIDDYDDEEQQQISPNATESINSESFPNSPNTQSFSNTSPNFPIQKLDTFVKIAPFPIFNGTNEECPFAHLSRFLKVCRANNVSSIKSMTRIFPITLENEAALWYDLNVEPYLSLSWKDIKSSFLEAYQKTNLESEITTMKHGENESVRSYFLRLQWVLKIYPDHGLKEEMIIRVFVNGLKGEYRDWVVSNKPDSLDDALRLAFDWEKERGLRNGGEVNEIMGKMRGLGLDEVRETKKSACQCSKHRCGTKKFERTDSNVSVKSNKNLLT